MAVCSSAKQRNGSVRRGRSSLVEATGCTCSASTARCNTPAEVSGPIGTASSPPGRAPLPVPSPGSRAAHSWAFRLGSSPGCFVRNPPPAPSIAARTSISQPKFPDCKIVRHVHGAPTPGSLAKASRPPRRQASRKRRAQGGRCSPATPANVRRPRAKHAPPGIPPARNPRPPPPLFLHLSGWSSPGGLEKSPVVPLSQKNVKWSFRYGSWGWRGGWEPAVAEAIEASRAETTGQHRHTALLLSFRVELSRPEPQPLFSAY